MKRQNISPVGNNQLETKEALPLSEKVMENLKASLVKEVTITRQSKGLSQKKLQDVSGLKQSVIARMELGETDPQLSTLIKALYPLGMTLSVVPLYTKNIPH